MVLPQTSELLRRQTGQRGGGGGNKARMAPRRGSRKRGLTRMDAALDAMRAYGFAKNMIVETIKELLQVYGEDGWPFIEDCSYKVLLDNILEKVEKQEEKVIVTIPQTKEALDSASEKPEAIVSQAIDTAAVTCDSGDRSSWKDITPGEDSGRKQTENVTATGSGDSSDVNHPGNSAGSPTPGKRKPYYGWISSEDEDDLVDLKPEPFSQDLIRFLLGTDRQERRKSGWDVKPEDM